MAAPAFRKSSGRRHRRKPPPSAQGRMPMMPYTTEESEWLAGRGTPGDAVPEVIARHRRQRLWRLAAATVFLVSRAVAALRRAAAER